jgi:hypothetical protein
MATGELLRPGVEVIQSFKATAPSFVRPTLAPCVVGAAFEVINVLNTDGTVNAKAKYGIYDQFGKSITESSFPDPRGNIDELDIQEDTVRPFLLAGGVLSELAVRPHGSAFLKGANLASKAVFHTLPFSGATGLALNGKVLVLSIDNPTPSNTANDVVVTFLGAGNLTSQMAADQINSAAGQVIATVKGTAPSDYVAISSPTFGALSSITVRAGASANQTLGIGWTTATHEERVVGAGFRAQDDNNKDTQSPWIEFFNGAYYLDGVDTTFAARAFLTKLDGTETSVKNTPSLAYLGSTPTHPLKVGDYFFCDGVRPNGAEVMKVEQSRFKLGTINPVLSTADANGTYTNKVYDISQVGLLVDSNPFSPTYAYFRANGIDWASTVATAASVTGSAGTAATRGTILGTGAAAGPFAITGLTLVWSSIADGVSNSGTFIFPSDTYLTMSDVAAALVGRIPGVTPSNVAGQLSLATTKTGASQTVTVKPGTCNSILGLPAVETSATGVDVSFTGITGKALSFKFDDNAHVVSLTCTSDSLDVLVSDINTALGVAVASKNGAGTALVLTSPLRGLASRIEVIVPSPTQAETLLGLTGGSALATGTGRPYPEAYLNSSSVLHISPEILRDVTTGNPLDQSYNTGLLYIQFKALRRDVTAVAQVAGVLKITDTDTLSTVLDPLTEENPLGLGLFLCMVNAPTYEVKGLGIDTVTGAAPEGTQDAWARAVSMLETEEIYAIAPLTNDPVVHGILATHATVMSQPELTGERIVFINKKEPVRKNPTITISGSQANSTSQTNELLLDSDPTPGLVAAGITTVGLVPATAGVYVEVVVDSQLRRYNVSSVAGALVGFRTSFAAGGNDDAFYSTVTMSSAVINAAYSVNVRGDSLIVPGSNPPRLDYSTMASVVSDANSSIKNRRVFSVFPDTVKTMVAGIEKSLPGYYGCAAIVGMVAAQPPQQGFTNFPITGLTGVSGPEKFTRRQLNIMAGGGTYILVQDAPGGAVYCRHQVSTDLTMVETRELSITKVVDFVAKFLRLGVRRFIGVNNINANLLDTLGATVHAILQFLDEGGVLNGFSVNNIAQDKSNPDTVLIDVTLQVPYPCNYIRLTLVI